MKANTKYNIVFAASAEEEISGINGIELVLPISAISIWYCCEPTQLEMAVAEEA